MPVTFNSPGQVVRPGLLYSTVLEESRQFQASPLVGNSNGPQLADLGWAAGFALFIAAAVAGAPAKAATQFVASPQQTDSAYVQFSPAAQHSGIIPQYIVRPPDDPTQLAALLTPAASSQLPTSIRQFVAAQFDQSQPPASLRAPYTVGGPTIRQTLAQPPPDTTQGQPWLMRPFGSLSATVRQLVTLPQGDPSQPTALTFQPLVGGQGVRQLFAYSGDPVPTPAAWVSPSAQQRPASRTSPFTSAAPQVTDTAQGWVFPTIHFTSLPTGQLGSFFTTQQQLLDINSSQIWEAIQIYPVPPSPPVVYTKAWGGRMILPGKKVGETIFESANFLSNLGVTETINSALVTASVYRGNDPTPSAIISGPASISGPIVQQLVTGGVLGTTYELLFAANTSLGQTIEIAAYLTIIPDLA